MGTFPTWAVVVNGAGATNGAARGAPNGAKYEAWLAPTKQASTTAMAYILIFVVAMAFRWRFNNVSCLFVQT